MTIKETTTVGSTPVKGYQTVPIVRVSSQNQYQTSSTQYQTPVTQAPGSRNIWDYLQIGASYIGKGIEWLLGVGSQAVDIYAKYRMAQQPILDVGTYTYGTGARQEGGIPATINIAGLQINTIVLVLALIVILILLFKK